MNDKILGINTLGNFEQNIYSGYSRYEPTPYLVLDEVIKAYPFSKKDVLVDFGCGLGRVVCHAVAHGCNKAIGIEVNTDLYERLYQNIQENSFKDRVNIYNMKAEMFKVVPEMNRFYFYNPFSLKYFIKVYNNIMKHVTNETIRLFMYNAAKVYRIFLESKENVEIEKIFDFGENIGRLWVYKVRTNF